MARDTFFVEVGKGGVFQSRNQFAREFSGRGAAERFAKTELAKGNAIVLDRISPEGGQKTLIQRGVRRGSGFGGNFGRFVTGEPRKRRKRNSGPFEVGTLGNIF